MMKRKNNDRRLVWAVLGTLLAEGTICPAAQAAVQNQPLSVTKPGQTVTDDFNIENCTAPAVVDIAASAAADKNGVTRIDTKSIIATFSNKGANGIWVHPDYPGTVKLADGLHIRLDSDGWDYDISGIYLDGVNRNSDPKGNHDESVNANEEYTANGNKISDTKVVVGSGTSITLNAGLKENVNRHRVFAVGLENHFGHMKVGNDVTLSVATGKFNNNKNTTYGFYQVLYGDTTIGDRLTSTVSSTADGNTKNLVISALTSAHDHPNDKQIDALAQDQLALGNDAHLTSIVNVTGETKKEGQQICQYGAYLSRTDYNIGKNLQVNVTQTGVKDAANDKIGGDIYTIGIYNYGAKGTIGAGLQDKVTVRDRAMGAVKVMYVGDSKVELGGRIHTEVQIENSHITGTYGFDLEGKSSLSMGDDSDLSVNLKGSTAGRMMGVYVSPASSFSAGDNLHMDLTFGAENPDGRVYGIRNEGTAKVGKNARITVNAPDERTNDTMAVSSYDNGSVTLGDGAVLTVNSKAENTNKIINNVVKADTKGKVAFDGGMTLVGSQNAIYSTDEGSSVTAMKDGRKVIFGNLESAKNGSIQLNLNTADSLFRGKSTVDGFNADASGKTELTLKNGARWDMTASSTVTGLDHGNGGLVNMQYNPEYQRLDVNQYSGQNGIFRMKTDLDSQTDGDKVYMNGAAAGSQGLVQVHDESFLTGKEVTGTKHLLLITDNSKNATFSGLDLDEGGLWDVTPTIRNGSYVHDVMGVADANDKQWYLTKLTRTINKDTRPLIAAADSGYGLYRESLDTLRQRMGDLRFLKKKDQATGLWARMRDGEFSGPDSLDTRYHNFQLGYDKAANPKTVYGVLAERGIASPSYAHGTGKDHSLAGAMYGTWFGDDGSYTDVMARYNRDDAHVSTYGGYPDRADWRSHDISASVEYGRTIPVNEDGYFVEPQAQFQLGHLSGYDYTTLRGKTVQADGTNSAIGRIGFVAGRRGKDARHPFDWYVKGSVLYEFAGDRELHLAAPDGETLETRIDNQGTWYTLGLGGSYRNSHRTYLYGDLERSFGGDLQKKWQVNVGVQYQF